MYKLLTLLFVLCLSPLVGQVDLGYQTPSKEILDLVDVPMPPSVRMTSDGETMILLYRNLYKSISELSETEMRLAGLRINPRTNISSRARYYFNMEVVDVNTGNARKVSNLPRDARLTNFSMSPDESKMAFTNTSGDAVELWVLDIKTNSASKISSAPLNANMGSPMVWFKDSKSLLVKVLPDSRPTLINTQTAVPTGPTISVNEGKKAQNRTYQDLLKNKTDEANFKILAKSELHKIHLNGQSESWKTEGMYRSMSFSPDGTYLLLNTVEEPFSYLVPYYRFPSKTEIYTSAGKMHKLQLKSHLVEDLPKGFMAVETGMRSIRWRSDQAATLYWTEALDGGDPAASVEYRDAVYQDKAPFTGDKQLLLNTKNRFSYIIFGNNNVAIAYDRWWNNRNTKTYLFNPNNPLQEPQIISDRSYQDRYSDPGQYVTKKNKMGQRVLDTHNDQLYLMGDGYSDKGIYPFVDAYSLKSRQSKRLWEADDTNALEDVVSAVDISKGKILTRIESKNDYPNYFFRDINRSKKKPTAVTKFDNPFKSISSVHKEVINYTREDGIELSATLYLPAGYDRSSGEKLPMLMWAYPREYKDKSSAGQVTSSPNEFTYPYYGSPIFWVAKGYAVLDDTAFPIIGEGDEQPNDSFVKQLVGNAKAAIDAVDRLGYIDRNRVGVGGHSYGAFMTANLLSHSDLFAAGIARSGAYNRTLTPFGFQAEERSYWEAPEIYYGMSPFMHADKMKTPLLLLHGEADNNSGTYPMQSERYFNALKGLGATVRLVMLPKESHGYNAKESVLHMLWEQDQWLDKYVKNRKMEKKEIEP